MNRSDRRLLSRRRAGIEMAACALAAWPFLGGTSRASTTASVERIEEDWVLLIGTPDQTNHAPGVKMIMSTQDDLLGYSADYSINFHKEGDPIGFKAGGFGIELCSPDSNTPINSPGPDSTMLNTAGEKLTWTQRLQLSNGTLSFSLRNTSSTTWGSNTGRVLKVSTNCPLSDLSNYDPAFSVANSGPVWWPDRVVSLTLVQVRYYDASANLLTTDAVSRPAYP
jgi:hypothetical protein